MTSSDPLPLDPDADARARAVDPSQNVVLEASAGTGKTYVLVERYLNLLAHGVDPANILAITFTRKAAAEMRGRIIEQLKVRAPQLRDRAGDVAISTIDAFCLSLLREFPLEADLDPGFDMADETQVPRLLEEALDCALDVGRGLTRSDEYVRLLFAELREPRLREALASMIGRRLVVEHALERALARGPADLTAEVACARAIERLRGVFGGFSGGVHTFLADGPVHHRKWTLVAADILMVADGAQLPPGRARGVLDRVQAHFLNKEGEPRQRFEYSARDCRSAATWKSHRQDVLRLGPLVADVIQGFRRDVNALLSRGVRRVYHIALAEYRKTLDSYGVLDFSEVLARALALLTQMDEFARSRYRLEGRYHHVLLDEFQDTSRAQWSLVALLIRSWGEGSGLAESFPIAPSIFVVGDRKQSIYSFRDADVSVMEDAGGFVDTLRADSRSRQAISRSFRAIPSLLAFNNDVFAGVEKNPARRDAFRFDEQDRFPVASDIAATQALGLVVGPDVDACARAVASEIRRLIDSGEPVRDPVSRIERPVVARDIAVLFRTRESHREFEQALADCGIPSYVYKGLGFFDADEVKDVLALLRYLAMPSSHLRAAAFLRSRLVRLSDAGLQALSPNPGAALERPVPADERLDGEDRAVLAHVRRSVKRWLALVDRITPAELLDLVLDESAYVFEIQGTREPQARENLKKIRAMIRRAQNSGYLTLARLAEHLDRLSAGDESNAVIDAGDSVSLMTVHAAKGLEFPVVFVVNLSRGTGNRRGAIRVVSEGDGGNAWLSVSDFLSEADEDARARDREETKRLLYVALTRARDRLYLASEVKEGRFRSFPGSLGEVLPTGVRQTLEAASILPDGEDAEWTGDSGATHVFRVCRSLPEIGVPLPPPVADVQPARFSPSADVVDPFALPREAATRPFSADRDVRPAEGVAGGRRVVGALVHRLFERFGAGLSANEQPAISAEVRRFISVDEAVEAGDVQRVIDETCASYARLCRLPQLSEALRSGDALFEVPFSFRASGSASIVRGTFDCLVRRDDGSMIVYELKTGQPAPGHDSQLAIYVSAARAMFPGTPVEGMIVYAGDAHLDDRPFDALG